MTYEMATSLLGRQARNLRSLTGMRFIKDGYEYKLDYEGGFGAFLAVYRRQVGRRNFKYYTGLSVGGCINAEAAFKVLMEELERKA